MEPNLPFCTSPWQDLFLQWDRTSCCCYLAFSKNPAHRIMHSSWAPWDDPDAYLQHPILAQLRANMREGNHELFANKCRLSCSSRRQWRAIPTDDNELHLHKVAIGVTAFCNARCTYCHLWRRGAPVPGRGELTPTLKRISRLVDALKQRHPVEVWFTGGEPLTLSERKLAKYMELLEPSRRLYVCSNGLCLTDALWQRYFANPKAHLRITLDTADPTVYQGYRGSAGNPPIWQNLAKIFHNQDLSRVEIGATIGKSNMAGISQLIRFTADLGVNKMWLNAMTADTTYVAPGENLFLTGSTSEVRVGLTDLVEEWRDVAKATGVAVYGIDHIAELAKH